MAVIQFYQQSIVGDARMIDPTGYLCHIKTHDEHNELRSGSRVLRLLTPGSFAHGA